MTAIEACERFYHMVKSARLPMLGQSAIRILENDPNRRGDLFGRLMGALFLALGYDQARLNIHKSGREIDVEAQHRTEARRVFAECKAEKDPIGGGDINKFVGSLDAERRKEVNTPTEGYFISLSGFTETAIEQEKEAGGRRLILLDADRVVEELTHGRIIVSEKKAAELAGRCVGLSTGRRLSLDSSSELLAHEIGWVWAIFFVRDKERSHFALVHADGEFISQGLTDAIIASDRATNGNLHKLEYLRPPASSIDQDATAEAMEKYFAYLASECGEIQMEGLPADQDVGSRRLRLENLFVPLRLVKSAPPSQEPPSSTPEGSARSGSGPRHKRGKSKPSGSIKSTEEENQERAQIGEVLGRHPRIAILGLPGGGKSTLLKRLATAYAFPDRRKLISDKLPDRNWFPLFVRCRQLGALVRAPIVEILGSVASRAEMTSPLATSFERLVSGKLRDGTALLLVDGLDEISGEVDRVCFVSQLRTFLSLYPAVALCVTSREAGFRIIGGALTSQCQHFRLDDFDPADIERLTLSWHREVVGDTMQVRSDAQKLATTICANDRLQRLASNPLLLKTLLLVKRWVGQLPTKRTVLYGKAIEVLLMTWNVEGHEPLDLDEAMPQLEYLALSMMKSGKQTVSARELRQILSRARVEMPEVLSCARLSVPEFVQRVESRSSLLILSGHAMENGAAQAIYEFRHLTFQEYLTARAVVDGHYPDRGEGEDLLTALRPHLGDENWREVVPLAAVLAGRLVQPLVAFLTEECKRELSGTGPGTPGLFAAVLGACLSDEIQAPPGLLKEAVKWVIRAPSYPRPVPRIGGAKYGTMLYEAVLDSLRTAEDHLIDIESNLTDMFPEQLGMQMDTSPLEPTVAHTSATLERADPIDKAVGCLLVMIRAYHAAVWLRERIGSPSLPLTDEPTLRKWRDAILPLRLSQHAYLRCAALWALAWIAETIPWSTSHIALLFPEALSTWCGSTADFSHLGSWIMSDLPLVDRKAVRLAEGARVPAEFLRSEVESPSYLRQKAALVAGYYLGEPWSDSQLVDLAKRMSPTFTGGEKWARQFLKALGYAEKLSIP